MLHDPKCMKMGRKQFYEMAKITLNDFKAQLMTSKYKTPYDFATDFRIALNCVVDKVKKLNLLFSAGFHIL
jgi:hypothetical protein